jgi:hypothetical protein
MFEQDCTNKTIEVRSCQKSHIYAPLSADYLLSWALPWQLPNRQVRNQHTLCIGSLKQMLNADRQGRREPKKEFRFLAIVAHGAQLFSYKLDKLWIFEASCFRRAVLDAGTAEGAFFLISCHAIFFQGYCCYRANLNAFPAPYTECIAGFRRSVTGWPSISVRKISWNRKGWQVTQ